MDRKDMPFPVPNSALQVTQPPIAKSDRRHGACDFAGESTVPSRRLLLRHNQDRRKRLAPAGVFQCSSLRVLVRSTRSFFLVACTVPPHVGLPCWGHIGMDSRNSFRSHSHHSDPWGLHRVVNLASCTAQFPASYIASVK